MSATKSQRSPRRKAGRASARNARPKLEFRLIVEGQEMHVSYEANWWGGEFPHGHFEFRSPHEPPRRIPVSETGYLSHFAPMADIETYPSAEEFAHAFVAAFLDRSRKRGSAGTSPEQLSLF